MHTGRHLYMSVCECKGAYQKFPWLQGSTHGKRLSVSHQAGLHPKECVCVSVCVCVCVYQPRPPHKWWSFKYGRPEASRALRGATQREGCWHSPLWPRRAQKASLRTALCRVTRWFALVISWFPSWPQPTLATIEVSKTFGNCFQNFSNNGAVLLGLQFRQGMFQGCQGWVITLCSPPWPDSGCLSFPTRVMWKHLVRSGTRHHLAGLVKARRGCTSVMVTALGKDRFLAETLKSKAMSSHYTKVTNIFLMVTYSSKPWVSVLWA